MDEATIQLLQMIAALTSGKDGASRSDLEKIITSPLIGLLTGGYDPMTLVPEGAEGGELWARYSQSADPDMAVILETIRRGGDKYQVEQAINDIVAEGPAKGRAPFQEFGAMPVESLKSLAEDLRKEYQTAPKNDQGIASQFKKWGLANPLEQYTAETAPLTTQGEQLRSMMAQRMVDLEEQSKRARKAASEARARVKEESKSETPLWKNAIAGHLVGPTMGLTLLPFVREQIGLGPNRKKASPEAVEAKKAAARANTDATWALMQARANEKAFKQGLEKAIAEKGGSPFQTQLGQRLAMAKFLGLT